MTEQNIIKNITNQTEIKVRDGKTTLRII